MAEIACTGAAGFVGRRIQARAAAMGLPLRPLSRDQLGDLGQGALDPQVFAGCRAVIHAAAIAHRPGTPAADYHRVNVDGTAAVVAAARAAGVRRLVFVSSIKALGERERGGRPLRPGDVPRPQDAYGRSKAAAEALVLAARDLAPVVARPPLVVGPGAQGNLERLRSIIARGLPLPLGATGAVRRSLVAVDDLADGLLDLATGTAIGPMHLAHAMAVSPAAMARAIAHGLGRPCRLVPVPEIALAPLPETRRRLFASLRLQPGGNGWVCRARRHPLVALALAARLARAGPLPGVAGP